MSAVPPLGLHRRPSWVKRLALLGLFGLQVGVAASAVLEPNHRSPVTHVEQNGTAHHFLVHDDAKCAACSVRSLHAAPAMQARLEVSRTRLDILPVRHAAQVRSRDDDRANPSRAPPTIG